MSIFRKAERKQAKLRIGLSGVSGSGKTISALRLAYGITKDWEKIFFIDTENGSGELYANISTKGPDDKKFEIGTFNYVRLKAPYEPEAYIGLIEGAQEAGAEVIIVDSITHEWDGKGGLLEIHAKMPGNSFTNWKEITPRHNRFIDAIVSSDCHMITCVRRKQEYSLDKNDKGQSVPVKQGMKEITREGFEYEVTTNLEVDISHHARSSKDRTGLFVNAPPFLINEETGEKLTKWANEGKSQKEVQKGVDAEFKKHVLKKLDTDAKVKTFSKYCKDNHDIADPKDLSIELKRKYIQHALNKKEVK